MIFDSEWVKYRVLPRIFYLRRKIKLRKTPKVLMTVTAPQIEKVLVSDGAGKMVSINVEELNIPQEVWDAVKILQSHGFLHNETDKIFFMDVNYADLPEYNPFGDIVIHTNADKDRNAMPEPAHLKIYLPEDMMLTHGQPADWLRLKNTSFSDFSKTIHQDFNHFLFTPKNGWGPIHYIHFLVSWRESHPFWRKKDIKTLDAYLTMGISPKTLGMLLTCEGVDMAYLRERIKDTVFQKTLQHSSDEQIRKVLNLKEGEIQKPYYYYFESQDKTMKWPRLDLFLDKLRAFMRW